MTAEGPAGRRPGPALLVLPALGRVRAVALLLPGGAAQSTAPGSRLRPGALRMLALAADLRRTRELRAVAVAVLRYRLAGWNDAAADPVPDARWALVELARRLGPLPVVLVGHSMGGRTAMWVADGEHVVGVVALAPWLPPGEPVGDLGRTAVLVAHGDADTVTDPRSSEAWVTTAAARGIDAKFQTVPGGDHGMLRPAATWQRIVRVEVASLLRPTLRGPVKP